MLLNHDFLPSHFQGVCCLLENQEDKNFLFMCLEKCTGTVRISTSSTPNPDLCPMKIPAQELWLQAMNMNLSFHSTFYCLYSDTLFPFIRSAFSPIGFLARIRFLMRSAIFCTYATIRHSAIFSVYCHSTLGTLPVGHAYY